MARETEKDIYIKVEFYERNDIAGKIIDFLKELTEESDDVEVELELKNGSVLTNERPSRKQHRREERKPA